MRRAATLILLWASCVSVVAQTLSTDPVIPFTSVERLGEANTRAFFVFSTRAVNYIIRHDGMGEAASPKSRKTFYVKTGAGARVDRVYFAEFEGDLILEYEVTDQRGNWAYITRMNQATRKVRWITPMSADLLGPALIEGNALYVSAANMLAKLDLRTGTFLWQQSEFEDSSSFELPTLRGNTIAFQRTTNPLKSIELDKLTGSILKK